MLGGQLVQPVEGVRLRTSSSIGGKAARNRAP